MYAQQVDLLFIGYVLMRVYVIIVHNFVFISKREEVLMNNNILFVITIIAIFSIYLVVRYFVDRNLQSNDNSLHNNSKLIILIINAISLVAMCGLIVYLFIGWLDRFKDGNKNYFNLVLLAILTIACAIRFWYKFRNNKL